MKRLVELTSSLTVGDPTKRDTFMGPVITETAMNNYLKYVDQGRKDGKVLIGGDRIENGPMSRGYYVAPTIIEGLPEDHELMRNELFVPILCVQRFKGLDEAIGKANNTDFGLTAGIFSKDEVEQRFFFENIQFGVDVR